MSSLPTSQLASQPRNESRTGGPRREQERNTPRSTNTPRTNTQGAGPASGLTPQQIVTLKAQGIVKYSGPPTNRIPAIADILEANGPSSGFSRICVLAIFTGRYCRWGADCKQKHIKRFSDFTPANKTKFLAYVQARAHVELTQPGTNA
jgi:hypothetical protein